MAKVLEAASEQYGVLQFVSPSGNGGDSLIDVGFFHLAERLGLRYRLAEPDDVDPRGVAVLSGGGGLVPEHPTSRMIELIEALYRDAEQMVILPQTILGHDQLLGKLGANVTLFAREQRTYDHILKHANGGANISIDHDMAFNLEASRLLSGEFHLPQLGGIKDYARLGYYAAALTKSRFSDTLDAFRVDGEAIAQGLRRSRLNDVSMITAFREGGVESRKATARMFLSLLNRYDEINTDRLHVAIGASLLRKRISMKNNSNGKLFEVYKFSLEAQSDLEIDFD